MSDLTSHFNQRPRPWQSDHEPFVPIYDPFDSRREQIRKLNRVVKALLSGASLPKHVLIPDLRELMQAMLRKDERFVRRLQAPLRAAQPRRDSWYRTRWDHPTAFLLDDAHPTRRSLVALGGRVKRCECQGLDAHQLALSLPCLFGDHATFFEATLGDYTNFCDAMFGDHANFSRATMGKCVNFVRTTVGDLATFRDARFGDHAMFFRARFGHRTSFVFATFGNEANFAMTTFGNLASFSGAQFGNNASFSNTTLGDRSSFCFATFGKHTSFCEAIIGEHANFFRSSFDDQASFAGARFSGDFSFMLVRFQGDVLLTSATMEKNANFLTTTIQGRFDATGLTLLRRLRLRDAIFGPNARLVLGDMLAGGDAKIELPPELVHRTKSESRTNRMLSWFFASNPGTAVLGEDSEDPNDLRRAAEDYEILAANFRKVSGANREEDRCHWRAQELRRVADLRDAIHGPNDTTSLLNPKRLFKLPWELLVRWLIMRTCLGYMLHLHRIAVTGAAVVFGCMLIYAIGASCTTIAFNGELSNHSTAIELWHESIWSPLYFSLTTFVTLGYGDFAPKGWFKLVTGIQALLGVTLVALFTVAWGRKMIRS